MAYFDSITDSPFAYTRYFRVVRPSIPALLCMPLFQYWRGHQKAGLWHWLTLQGLERPMWTTS